MKNMPLLNSLFDTLQLWLSRRKHYERIGLLLIGLTIIYTIWYVILLRPLNIQRSNIKQESATLKDQMNIFTASAQKIKLEVEARAKSQALNKQHPGQRMISIASAADSDEIIKEILNTHQKVKFLGLKTGKQSTPDANTVVDTNKPASGSDIEIMFNSDYFNTITYLTQLENLPWCLSWNSLSYKVNTYPLATITINLLIVNS